MITHGSQVTDQPQMASTRFAIVYIIAAQVLTEAECLHKVIKVEDKSRLKEECMDFCTSPLSLAISRLPQRWTSIGMQLAT